MGGGGERLYLEVPLMAVAPPGSVEGRRRGAKQEVGLKRCIPRTRKSPPFGAKVRRSSSWDTRISCQPRQHDLGFRV